MKITAVLAGCMIIFAAGCENSGREMSAQQQIRQLKQENAQLITEIEQSNSETEQLKKQINVLSGLKPPAKTENIYDLQEIKITKYTNLYDKDNDGKKETLIVYVQPIDKNGDIVKAGGAVDVELWNLDKKSGEALLGQWHVGPQVLRKLWFAAFITINYRLTFDVADKVDSSQEALIVKTVFTDYLTGRVFKEQKTIKQH